VVGGVIRLSFTPKGWIKPSAGENTCAKATGSKEIEDTAQQGVIFATEVSTKEMLYGAACNPHSGKLLAKYLVTYLFGQLMRHSFCRLDGQQLFW
jgi:hypothetical protein